MIINALTCHQIAIRINVMKIICFSCSAVLRKQDSDLSKESEDDGNQQLIERMDCQQNNTDFNESKEIPLIDLTSDGSMDTTSPHNSTNDSSQQMES